MQTLTGSGTVTTTGASVGTISTIPDTVDRDDPSTGTNESTVTFSHQVNIGGAPGAQQINIALVVDVTNSTALNAFGNAGFDVDGDGVVRNGSGNPGSTTDPNDVLFNSPTHDSILLAEKVAAKALFQQYVDAGYDPSQINISLVSFTAAGGVPAAGYVNHGVFDLDNPAAFNAAVDGLQPRAGQTSYQAGLNCANAALTSAGAGPNDINQVIFLTDGGNNFGGTGGPGRTTLENNFGADIVAIGVGPENARAGATSTMNVIDNTGGSVYLSTGAQLATLADVIVQPPASAPLTEIVVTFEYVDVNGDPATMTVTYPAGDPAISSTPSGYIIKDQTVTLVPPPRVIDGSITEVKVTFDTKFADGSEVPSGGSIGFLDVVCFANGTLIKTIRGDIAIEDLEVGDQVLTLDNSYQPILWIGSRRLTAFDLTSAPRLRPIRIKVGALGAEKPTQDLLVSPQHRVLCRSAVAERMFGEREVLVAAKHLIALDGIDVADDLDSVTYWHLMFDSHQVVFSNGAATESMFTGPMAMRSVSEDARAEILAIFPQLAEAAQEGFPAVRTLISGRGARQMAMRLHKNHRTLIDVAALQN